jgi:hypothetical protein
MAFCPGENSNVQIYKDLSKVGARQSVYKSEEKFKGS